MIERVKPLLSPLDPQWQREARRVLELTKSLYPWTAGLKNISPQQLANYSQTTLASGITNAATTATLTSVAGLPTVGNFRLIITDLLPATTFEIVEVSSVNVGTGVVTFSGGAGVGRGLENTTAIAHNAGAIVGNDLTAGMLSLAFPGGILGYAQVTAGQGGFNSAVAVDLTSLTVTVTVGTNRRIKITGYCHAAISTVANDVANMLIAEGATILQDGRTIVPTGNGPVVQAVAYITPNAGAHTYKLQGARQGGTGSITFDATATAPMFIAVEDVGQA